MFLRTLDFESSRKHHKLNNNKSSTPFYAIYPKILFYFIISSFIHHRPHHHLPPICHLKKPFKKHNLIIPSCSILFYSRKRELCEYKRGIILTRVNINKMLIDKYSSKCKRLACHLFFKVVIVLVRI